MDHRQVIQNGGSPIMEFGVGANAVYHWGGVPSDYIVYELTGSRRRISSIDIQNGPMARHIILFRHRTSNEVWSTHGGVMLTFSDGTYEECRIWPPRAPPLVEDTRAYLETFGEFNGF